MQDNKAHEAMQEIWYRLYGHHQDCMLFTNKTVEATEEDLCNLDVPCIEWEPDTINDVDAVVRDYFKMTPIKVYPLEPTHGSVVLTSGPTGTAWQRHFKDGLWHSTTGHVFNWYDVNQFFSTPDIIVIYNAPEEN